MLHQVIHSSTTIHVLPIPQKQALLGHIEQAKQTFRAPRQNRMIPGASEHVSAYSTHLGRTCTSNCSSDDEMIYTLIGPALRSEGLISLLGLESMQNHLI